MASYLFRQEVNLNKPHYIYQSKNLIIKFLQHINKPSTEAFGMKPSSYL